MDLIFSFCVRNMNFMNMTTASTKLEQKSKSPKKRNILNKVYFYFECKRIYGAKKMWWEKMNQNHTWKSRVENRSSGFKFMRYCWSLRKACSSCFLCWRPCLCALLYFSRIEMDKQDHGIMNLVRIHNVRVVLENGQRNEK